MQRPALPDDLSSLELLPEGVLALDATGAVRWLSARGRELTGLGDDAVGMHVDKALEMRTEGGDRCPLDDALTGHGERIAERLLDIVLEDGRKRPVAVAGSRLDDGVLLTFRHAGRRKFLDRARSDLVATVSHEIRSPLTSVKGFTKTLLLKWDRFKDDQKKLMLETINEDADRVTRLLTELLDVSRIDADRVSLRRTAVDVGAVASGIVERARVKPLAEHRELVLDVIGDVPRTLLDSDKVEQVLTNLVENALNYSEGRITVRVSSQDEAVHVAIIDEGPGIAKDQSRSIFEKFGRGREVRRAGTGLGLYISRGLVRAHGGDIVLDSDTDRGSTFTTIWPRVTTTEL